MPIPTRAEAEAADRASTEARRSSYDYQKTERMSYASDAERQRAELLANPEFVTKYTAGEPAAVAQMDDVNKAIVAAPATTGPNAVEIAETRKADLLSDPDWVAKYMRGNSEAKAEMLRINEVIATARFNRKLGS
jgi:hypothetical protein